MKLLAILAVAAGYYFLNRFIEAALERQGEVREVSHARIFYIQKTIQLALFIVAVIISGFILGFGYGELTFAFTSAVALLGVALFAQWSVLSNVTASLIIFFFFPYRPGDRIRVLDGDIPEGLVDEITLFHLILDCDDGTQLTLPTTLVFQKAVIITTNKPKAIPSEMKPENTAETATTTTSEVIDDESTDKTSAASAKP
ncbi:MAG: mechanosensitive ion channel domain-containing protein [Oceanobacter sp.]